MPTAPSPTAEREARFISETSEVSHFFSASLSRSKFALLLPDLRIIGNNVALRSAMHSGKLAAFVLARPGAPETQPAPDGGFAAEFEKRFVLVTPENVDQAMRTYPQLFPAN